MAYIFFRLRLWVAQTLGACGIVPRGSAIIMPGDTVILRTDATLSRDHAERLNRALADRMPGNSVILLDGGLRVEAVRRGTAEEKAAALDRLNADDCRAEATF